MAELEELEQEDLDKNLLEIGGTENLPSVPSTSLPSKPGIMAHKKAKLVLVQFSAPSISLKLNIFFSFFPF